MTKKGLFVVLLFLCQSLHIYGHSLTRSNVDTLASVTGHTFENIGGRFEPASDVFVRLIEGSDTLVTQASRQGDFLFKDVKPGKKTILASSMTYHPTLMEVELLPGGNAVIVQMRRKDYVLDPAVTLAKVDAVTQKGDTLIYHPAAVKTMEGENAIDILRQMPGVEVKEEAVYVNGQKVERAYVNGLLIFGDDPISSLNAILAKDVKQISSYEELTVESKMRGDENGQKDRVLDIKTKEPLFSAFDGYVQAAAGADENPASSGAIQPRYLAGVNANFFSEMFLAYANVFSNNIGTNDNYRYNLPNEAIKDYQRKSHVGLGTQKYWGDRLMGNNVRFAYSYDADTRRSNSFSRQVYQDLNNSPARTVLDTLTSQSREETHSLRIDATINDPCWKSWYISSYFDLGNNGSLNLHKQSNRIADGGLFHINQEQGRRGRVLRGFTHIGWQNSSSKFNWFPSAMLRMSFNPESGDNWIVDTMASSINRRYISASAGSRNMTLYARAGSEVRLVNKQERTANLGLYYSATYNHNNRFQLALDLYDANGAKAVADTNSVDTYHFTRNYFAHGPVAELSLHSQAVHLQFTAGLDFARQTDKEFYPAYLPSDRYFFLPNGRIGMSIKKFSANYSLTSSIPAVEQYRDRLDNSNPFSLVAGNPSLKESRMHSLKLNYELPLLKLASQLSFTASASMVSNAVVSAVQYFSQPTVLEKYDVTTVSGSTLSTFENVQGVWNTSFMVRYSARVKNVATIITYLSADYGQKPFFQGEEKVFVRDFTPGWTLSAEIRPDRKTRFNIQYSIKYLETKNNYRQMLTQAINNHLFASARYNIGKYLVLDAKYVLDGYSFLNKGFNDVSNHFLVAAAGVKLLKGRMTITLSGNDLLGNGSGYIVQAAGNHVLESWRPSFGRYYLIGVYFRLNKLNPVTVFQGELSTGQVPNHLE